jgi:hypothetical protein
VVERAFATAQGDSCDAAQVRHSVEYPVGVTWTRSRVPQVVQKRGGSKAGRQPEHESVGRPQPGQREPALVGSAIANVR